VRAVKTGQITRTLPCDLSQIHDLSFSPDGKLLAVAGGTPAASGVVRVFAWPKGDLRFSLSGHTDVVTAVAFSPDGTRLATASTDRRIRVYEIEWGERVKARPQRQLTGHAGAVLDVGFSTDGQRLVTASADRTLKVWEAGTGKLLRSLGNHTGIVHCVAFAPLQEGSDPPAGPVCASGSADRTVRVWQPEIGRLVRIVRGPEAAVLAVLYSREGSRIFAADAAGIIRAIDSGSDEIRHTWKAHDGWIYSLALTPDGSTLASGDWSGSVKLWDSATGKPLGVR
jgi:WD40 repeat protein